MSSDNEDKSLDPLALLRKSRAALAAEQAAGPSPTIDERSAAGRASDPERRSKRPKASDDHSSHGADQGEGQTYMYRGRPVARGRSAASAEATPTRQSARSGRKRNPKAAFRGASVARASSRNPSKDGGQGDVKQALRKLAHLEREGLISRAEYEAKRREILDRI